MTQHGDANTSEATMQFTYDENLGNLTSITDANGHKMEFFAYDVMGNPSRIKDYRGLTWEYSYDAMGRLVSATDPLGQATQYEYDDVGNVTAVIDEAGNRFEYVYDLGNNLIKTIDPFGLATEIVYNSDDLPTKITDRAGKVQTAIYDNEGHLISSIDGADNEVKHSYNNASLLTKIDYPTYTQSLSYDKLQRLIKITEAGRFSVHYAYDPVGNLISQTDQQGTTTLFEYDALNRLIKVTDALGGVTQLSYDDRDNLLTVTDANNGVTRYEYDLNNNLIKTTRPSGTVMQYEYDANENLVVFINDEDRRIEYEYDVLNRLTQIRQPHQTVSLTYDAVGNVLSYSDGSSSATYSYDALGRQLTESVNYGSFTLGYSYEYYPNGLKKSFTGPDRVKITYLYDENNRLEAIQIGNGSRLTVNKFHWNSPEKVTLPGGSQVDLSYDSLMRLKSHTVKDPMQSLLMDFRYEYSPVDDITKKTTEHGAYAYQYDVLSRLVDVTSPVLDNESYTYDLLGNRLTAGNVEASYDSNNAMRTYDGASFEYFNDNLARKTVGSQTTIYGYDIANRLVQVRENNSDLARYGYDPFGRRLWKEVDGVKTYFLYADEGLIGEFDEQGNQIKGYGYAPDSFWSASPLFLKTNGSYFWYSNDQLGTPQKLIDSSGNVVWEAYYEAFGEAHIQSELVENNLRFPGQYFDAETGFHQNYLRDYDPETGRYLEFDPIGLSGGPNGYIYVGGNPVNLSDPTGELAPLGAAALYYARCVASCAAMNAIANQMGGAACDLLFEENCWLGCLNPFGKLGKANKMAQKLPSCGRKKSFSNQLPSRFETELASAKNLGIKPIEVGPTEQFDDVINSGRIKWAVDEQGKLSVVPHTAGGEEIAHSVITGGKLTLAAGEADIAGNREAGYFGLEINRHSGHFMPNRESLDIGVKAFEKSGINFDQIDSCDYF